MLGGHSGREEGCARKVVLGGGAAGGGRVLISLSNPLFQCGEAMSNHLYLHAPRGCFSYILQTTFVSDYALDQWSHT